MARSTFLADLFRQPALVAQRHYEICRAYYLEDATAEQLAARFSLQADSVRSIVKDFAASPDPAQFFVVKQPGPTAAPKRDALVDEIVRLRREGLNLGEIRQRLHEQGQPISESYLYRILESRGLSGPGMPRARRRLAHAKDGSDIPAVADVQCCQLRPGRSFPTRVARLFPFVPLLLAGDFA